MAQINKSSEYFNTKLYTGNGSTGHAITGVGFQPDWLWIKERSSTSAAFIYDIIRGVDVKLTPSTTDGDATNSDSMSSFDSDGFTVGVNNATNENTQTYVAWNWLASNTTASNTDGSITSNVSANTTSGFSIVSYTGNATSGATIGHGLGVAPKMLIAKNRTNGTTNWGVWHTGIPINEHLILNGDQASSVYTGFFNNTLPSTSVVTLGNDVVTNGSGNNIILYCFAEKKGFSKFGSYTGNGNADGTFVYTGFKPAWVMAKKSNSTGNWVIVDTKRDGYNGANDTLQANVTDVESGGNRFDIVSNGFKARSTSSYSNSSGDTFIYMAFAAEPLTGTNGVPCTAR